MQSSDQNKGVRLPDGWGDARLQKVDTPETFWRIFDELCMEGSDFVHNRGQLLDAYSEGALFTLVVDENDHMCSTEAGRSSLLMRESTSCYELPCFCIVYNNECNILWVATRARRRGIASMLMTSLTVTSLRGGEMLPGSEPFWEHYFTTAKICPF